VAEVTDSEGAMTGYEVDPDTLRTASRKVYDGSDSIGDAAALLAVAQLVPAALGEVAAAQTLSTAFATFVGVHGDDLKHGAVWVNDAADGLVGAAEDYEEEDAESARSMDGIALTLEGAR
jgi:hypothetical protein